MLGTSKNHVFHVKWKMSLDFPPTCSHMFPNMLFIVPDILDEQRVGEHVRVTGYKSRVLMFPNNLVCVFPQNIRVYTSLKVGHCAPLSALASLGFFPPAMPCPPPGFDSKAYHLVVAEEAKLAVGKLAVFAPE